MGLDTTHDCWHGSCGSFNLWRRRIADAIGMPPLDLMQGFGGTIEWDALKHRPIHWLLNHSDCDGEIPADQCGPIADELEKIYPLMVDSDWQRQATSQFISGLRLAASRGEAVEFH